MKINTLFSTVYFQKHLYPVHMYLNFWLNYNIKYYLFYSRDASLIVKKDGPDKGKGSVRAAPSVMSLRTLILMESYLSSMMGKWFKKNL